MTMTPEQAAEIAALRSQSQTTRRATVPALEEILYEPLNVLDHGFVRVIDYMGDDSAVVPNSRSTASTMQSSFSFRTLVSAPTCWSKWLAKNSPQIIWSSAPVPLSVLQASMRDSTGQSDTA